MVEHSTRSNEGFEEDSGELLLEVKRAIRNLAQDLIDQTKNATSIRDIVEPTRVLGDRLTDLTQAAKRHSGGIETTSLERISHQINEKPITDKYQPK